MEITFKVKMAGGCFLIVMRGSMPWEISHNWPLSTNNSYITTPNKYQSTAFPCPHLLSISGARYATEPQKDLAP